jgi:hypothetical protein
VIRSYTLGADTKKDRDLYAWIGHFLMDAALHEQIGMPITGHAGDHWYVATPDKGRARGFASMRANKSGEKFHIRYAYADTSMLRRALLTSVIKDARKNGAATIFTNERHDDEDLSSLGFKIVSTRRGSFARWELQFNNVGGSE